MRIAIAGINGRDDSLLLQIKKKLENLNIEASLLGVNNDATHNADIVFVTGGDRGILNYYHKVTSYSAPVIGIYESDSTGFLTRLHIQEIESAIDKLKRGEYEVESVCRLAVNVDGKMVEPVLNDIAVFPSKSAIMMEHILRINKSDMWHDQSDGIIVSTPTGSTAYSMSAGGPMVLMTSQVFVIVSVNSLDNTRRPLVVPNDSSIEISNIVSRYHCEVILDGGSRISIKNRLECYKHQYPAFLVRFSEDSPATTLMAKKLKLAEDLLSMPPSAKLLLKTLEYEGALSQKELASKTILPERTVRMALSHLLRNGYVKRKTSLRDARQKIYELRYQ